MLVGGLLASPSAEAFEPSPAMVGLFVREAPGNLTRVDWAPPASRVPRSATVIGDSSDPTCGTTPELTCGTDLGKITAPFGFTFASDLGLNVWLNATVPQWLNTMRVDLLKKGVSDPVARFAPGTAPRDAAGQPLLLLTGSPQKISLGAERPTAANRKEIKAGDELTLTIAVWATQGRPNSTSDIHVSFSSLMPSGIFFSINQDPGSYALGEETLGVYLEEGRLTFTPPPGTAPKTRTVGNTPTSISGDRELVWGSVTMDDDVRAVGDGLFTVSLILKGSNPTASPRTGLQVRFYIGSDRAVGGSAIQVSVGSASTAAPGPLKFVATVPLNGVAIPAGTKLTVGLVVQNVAALTDYNVLYGSTDRASGLLIPVAAVEEGGGKQICVIVPAVAGAVEDSYTLGTDTRTVRIPAGGTGSVAWTLSNDGDEWRSYQVTAAGLPPRHRVTVENGTGTLAAHSTAYGQVVVAIDGKTKLSTYDLDLTARVGPTTVGPLRISVVVDRVAEAPSEPFESKGATPPDAPEANAPSQAQERLKVLSEPPAEVPGLGALGVALLLALGVARRRRALSHLPSRSKPSSEEPNTAPTIPPCARLPSVGGFLNRQTRPESTPRAGDSTGGLGRKR